MTVEALTRALDARPDVRFVVMSETLFFLLDDLGEIECRQVEKGLPDNPGQHGPVRKLLRSHVQSTKLPLKLAFFVFKQRPNVHIDCVMLHSFHLDSTGPNSFVLYGEMEGRQVGWATAEPPGEASVAGSVG